MDTPNRRTTSAHAAHVPARLQATWAELVRRLGVSNFEKNYIFGILMKNCTKYQLAIKIRDVAGTPNVVLRLSYKFPIDCKEESLMVPYHLIGFPLSATLFFKKWWF